MQDHVKPLQGAKIKVNKMLFYFLKKKDLGLTLAGIAACVVDAFLGPVANILIGKVFKSLSNFQAQALSSDEFMAEILQWCAGLWSLALIQVFSSWSSYTLWTLIGYRQGHRARSQLYSALIGRDFDWFDTNDRAIGTATMSFKDIQDLEQAVGSTMRDMISATISIILQIIVALYYSWSVTLISLAGLPLLVLCTMILSAKVHIQVVKAKTLLDQVSSKSDWILRSLSTVISFQRQAYESGEMKKLFSKDMRFNMNQHHLTALLQGITRFLILAIFVQGFFFGSYMVRNHGLNAGNVMTVFWSCLAVAGGFSTILTHLLGLQTGLVAARRIVSNIKRDRLKEFRGSIGLMPPNLMPGHGEVKFEDVVFSYPTRPAVILAGLSVTFEAGKISYVLGPSGSGKSSLGALICGQYSYQGGQITIDGIPIPHLSQRWIEQNVYIVEQQARLFDIPLVENIRIGSLEPQLVDFEDVQRICDELHIDFTSDLPNGLLTRGSYPLSGGQKQRIGLARAFVRDAPIMVFDESTSALDPGLRSFVMKAILKFRRNKTTIIITHQMDLIPAHEPIYYVEDGQACFYPSLEQYKRQSVMPLQTKCASPPTQPASKPEQTSSTKSTFHMLRTVQHKALLLLGFILVSAQAAVNPVFGFLFSKLLMGILPGSNVNTTLWALLVLLLAFIDGALNYSHVVLDFVAEAWQSYVRASILNRLLSRRGLDGRKVSYYNKLLFSDTERASLIIASYWPALVNLAILGLMALVWCLVEGWELSLIGLSISPLFFVATQCYRMVSVHWNAYREMRRNDTLKILVEVVEGFQTVKTQHLESFFEELYQRREEKVHEVAIPMSFWVGLMHGVVKLFPLTAQGLLLWYGMHLIATAKYTADQTMMVFTILIFALMTMSGIAGSISTVSNGFEASQRLEEAEMDEECQDTPPFLQHWEADDFEALNYRRIKFNDVGITYANGTSVLTGFTVDIAANEAVAIIGPSGSGKSTLARMLLKLEIPTQGSIYIDNAKSIDKIPQDILRRRIAVVGQLPLDFLDNTIMENLLYALPEDTPRSVGEKMAMQACADCGVDRFILDLEDGYDTRIKSGLLSGGQMQRLGIARCLIRKPDTLVLDECTSALDAESFETIKSLILEIKNERKMTLLIITHQMEAAAVADRIISLF